MRLRLSTVLGLAVALTTACAWGVGPTVTYRLRGIVTAPLSEQAIEGTLAFARTFCSTLTHLDPLHAEWGACDQYIETRVTEQPPPSTDISSGWKILVVGGIFSHCFEQKQLYAFKQALDHLESVHHLETHLLMVGSVDAPERNAETIAKYLDDHPGKYIAVGHSKGAVDLMVALQTQEAARRNIHALVSVAGAISGSRLSDLGPDLTILGFRKAVHDSGLGDCQIQDNGGIASMRREARNAFLRQWTPPPSLRSYSIVGVVDKKHTSTPLHTMWTLQSTYSIDQDSQMVAEEAVIPGARFLGVAKGDHWALALPFSEYPDPNVQKKVDHNRYPRIALLEAIVRFIDSGA